MEDQLVLETSLLDNSVLTPNRRSLQKTLSFQANPISENDSDNSPEPLGINKKELSQYKADKYIRNQQRAFALFQDLNANLIQLDHFYKDQMEMNEQDFLAAYRGHMNNIQKEVAMLKMKLTDKELKIKRDQKVAELSSQVGWFRKEALSLKNEVLEKNQVAKEVKSNNFILSEEKWALEQALGRQQKKSKALEETLTQTQESNKQMLQIIQEQQNEINRLKKSEIKRQIFAQVENEKTDEVFLTENKIIEEEYQLPKELQEALHKQQDFLMTASHSNQKTVDEIFNGKNRGKIDYFLAKVMENSMVFTKQEIQDMIAEFHNLQIQRYEKTLKGYQKRLYKREPTYQINNHNTNVNFNVNSEAPLSDSTVFGGVKSKNTQSDNELLEIFRRCVEQLKLDRPKINQVDTRTAMRAAQRLSQQKEHQRSKTTFFGTFEDASASKKLLADDLKAHEKRALVSHFLHNDEVFVHICNNMFPQQKEQNAEKVFQHEKETEKNAQIYSELQEQPLMIMPPPAQSTTNLFLTETDQLSKPNKKVRPQSGYPQIGNLKKQSLNRNSASGQLAIKNQLTKIVSEESFDQTKSGLVNYDNGSRVFSTNSTSQIPAPSFLKNQAMYRRNFVEDSEIPADGAKTNFSMRNSSKYVQSARGGRPPIKKQSINFESRKSRQSESTRGGMSYHTGAMSPQSIQLDNIAQQALAHQMMIDSSQTAVNLQVFNTQEPGVSLSSPNIQVGFMSQRYEEPENHDTTAYIQQYDLMKHGQRTLDNIIATESTPESIKKANRSSAQNVYVQNQGTSPYSKGFGSIQSSNGLATGQRPKMQSSQIVEEDTESFIGHKKIQPKHLGGLRSSANPVMVPKNVQNFIYPGADESFDANMYQGFAKKHQRQKSAKIGGKKKQLMIDASGSNFFQSGQMRIQSTRSSAVEMGPLYCKSSTKITGLGGGFRSKF